MEKVNGITKKGNVIILNKPFLGGWLNQQGNIGHEIIDFFYTDNDELYVYNLPWGVCPDDIWVDGTPIDSLSYGKPYQKYYCRYLLLTSESNVNKSGGCSFYILYVIELESKLHAYHTSNDYGVHKKHQEDIIEKVIIKNGIKYNGKYLYETFKSDKAMYITFKAKQIYEANNPILVECSSYKFQRNKGYLYKDDDDKNRNDYDEVNELIKSLIKNNKLTLFKPSKVTKPSKTISGNKTFLDLCGMQFVEQAYTNILFDILSYNDLILEFCKKFDPFKIFDSTKPFQVSKENKIVNGRMDICAESESQRIVIENKVLSGLNGENEEDATTQLSTYYKWASEKSECPLCFLLVPDFRKKEIEQEIDEFDPLMKGKYIIVTYGQVADFIIEQFKSCILDNKYEHYSIIIQIIDAFRNLQYSSKQDLYADLFYKATI